MNKNIITDYLGDSLKVKPNFKEFTKKNNISFQKTNENKLINIFNGNKLKFAIYTLFVLTIGIFSTIIISNFNGHNNSGDISPTKNVELLIDKGLIDKFIAFGPDRSTNLFTSNIILKSNIISETDKDVLRNYEGNGYSNLFYNLYFGAKDGKDMIFLHHLGKPYDILIFDSNLDYSFQSIIDDFELQSGIALTNEFLLSSRLDSTNKQVGGIIISFNEIDGILQPLFTSFIDNKTYIVSK